MTIWASTRLHLGVVLLAVLAGAITTPVALVAVTAAILLPLFAGMFKPLVPSLLFFAIATTVFTPIQSLVAAITFTVTLAALPWLARYNWIPSMSTPVRVTLIEGPIAAGKTTLAFEIAQRMRAVTVSYEEVDDSLLELFYENQTKYAFALQLVQLELRATVFRTALSGREDATLDRSLPGDACFAAWNYVLGNLSEAEYGVYCSRFNEIACRLSRSVTGVDTVIVYMATPSGECARRLAKRPGVDTNIERRYQLGLACMHALILPHIAHRYGWRLIRYSAAAHETDDVPNWTAPSHVTSETPSDYGVLDLTVSERMRLSQLELPRGCYVPLRQALTPAGLVERVALE